MDNREGVPPEVIRLPEAIRLAEMIQSLQEVESVLRGRGDEELAARLAGIVSELSSDGGKKTAPTVSPELAARLRRSADVEKCPRCALRSLHPEPSQLRWSADGATVEAMRWLCASCGHEVWRPLTG